ncbi:Protein Disulfide-Isomerase A6 [Manis pentadactyla]|nr:Protein Disulfide-Isomerase A6 [Manis pentadactyla]
MTDVAADGVSSVQIDLDHHGVSYVTSVLTLNVQVKCEILEPGLQLALVVRDNSIRKELVSGSHVTGSARCRIMVMALGYTVRKSMHMIRLRRELGFNSDDPGLQCKVKSMVMVEFRPAGPAFRISERAITLKLMLSVQDKVFCKEKSMRYIWLWTELGSNSDVEGTGVTLIRRFKES